MQSLLDPSEDALKRAWRIQFMAASVGFDWPDVSGVLDKVREEIEEIASALKAGDEQQAKRELGDLLFSAVNLARFLRADPEKELDNTTQQFQARFDQVRDAVARSGRQMTECTLAEMDALWECAKKFKKMS